MSEAVHPIGPAELAAFREALPEWFQSAARNLPWRQTDAGGRRDPFRVWVAEVMLQQTRVDQAIPYFERFVAAFPNVDALAHAELEDVLRLWEGLGYYSRARSLHRAARVVLERFDGRVPRDKESISSLPGVGSYTAAAVLSLAYDVPLAALDGNVIRVLTRVFAIESDVRKLPTRRRLQETASRLLDPAYPGRSNEAVMELGATVCTPRNPCCATCPLRPVCRAAATGESERFPVKGVRGPVPHHDVGVAVISDPQGRVLIQRRPEDAMLGGLWEFPGGKVEAGETAADACAREVREELGTDIIVEDPILRLNHAYSHFKITLHAFHARLAPDASVIPEGESVRWVTRDALAAYPFPRANRRLTQVLQANAGAASNKRAPSLF